MDHGYVKSFRAIYDGDLKGSPALHVFMFLYHVATHRQLKRKWKGKERTLQPGEYILTTKTIAETLAMTEMQVRHAVKYLKLTGRITTEISNEGTLFFVTKYAEYQFLSTGDNTPNNNQNNNPITNEYQTNNKPTECSIDREQEWKNGRMEEGDTPPLDDIDTPPSGEVLIPEVIDPPKPKRKTKALTPISEYPPEVAKLAADWLEWAKASAPHIYAQGSWSVEKYAEALRRAMNATGITPEGLRKVFNYVQGHHFWRENFITPVNMHLAKKGKDMSKLNRVILEMKPKHAWQEEQLDRAMAKPVEEKEWSPF